VILSFPDLYLLIQFTFSVMSSLDESVLNAKVGIIGSGLIGRSWAMLFAAAGYRVSLYDSEVGAVGKAKSLILEQLDSLHQQKLLRGSLAVSQQHSLISEAHSLEDCVLNSVYVQECVPENLELKQKIFSAIDEVVDDEEVVLASSSSCIPPSKFSENLKHRSQIIVAHPVNPPYFVPLVEIVPAPWTSEAIKQKARKMMEIIGQSAITLKKEIAGFALNRIQYAVINECWRLVEDDLLSVEDVDRVMKDGLGPRYAFMGPFETIHLNAEGVGNYCLRYGETIWNVSQTFGPTPRLAPDDQITKRIEDELAEKIPLDQLEHRRQWRDDRLAELVKLKMTAQNRSGNIE
jgi:L-gulonate 3-dehydrogenase